MPTKEVNFLIAGAQKGGTSSLAKYLKQHPQVGMGKRKELHYFDDEENFVKKPRYKKLHGYFDLKRPAKARGEGTPIYIYWPEAVRRIWEYNPEMRLIVVLRNPIERAWSHWKMQFADGRDTVDFSTAIRTESDRTRESLPLRHREFSYVDRGFYSEQIRNLDRFFPRSQVLFLKSEQFFVDPGEAMTRVLNFLKLDPFSFDVGEAHNVSPPRGSLSDLDRKYLLDVYQYDILQTQKLLGWDCSDWLQ